MKNPEVPGSPSKSKLILLAGAALALAGFAQSADAATSAFTIGSGGWSGSTGNFVVGYEFQTTNTISITHLGITDWANNGLIGSPQVGVWKTDGTLLASITIPAGAGSDLVETQSNPNVTYYLEQLSTALVLAPGNYVIANQHTDNAAGSQVFGWGGPVTFASGLTWVRGVAESNGGTSLVFPNDISFTASKAYIGPQFKFDVVPEPSSLACTALAGALLLRRRRD